MLINLIDARRGLHEKCVELFTDKNIAEQIYRKLCEGIDDCEEVSPAEKTGIWIKGDMSGLLMCSDCGEFLDEFGRKWDYCPNCGARMVD